MISSISHAHRRPTILSAPPPSHDTRGGVPEVKIRVFSSCNPGSRRDAAVSGMDGYAVFVTHTCPEAQPSPTYTLPKPPLFKYWPTLSVKVSACLRVLLFVFVRFEFGFREPCMPT